MSRKSQHAETDEQKKRRQALAQLVAQTERDLRVYFRQRLNDAPEADELAQDSYTRFANSQYDPGKPDARAILFGIAKHIFIDHIRRTRHENSFMISLPPSLAEQVENPTPTPEKIVQTRHDLDSVVTFLRALPERSRIAFTLSRVDGLKHSEIAERMSISKSLVEKLIMDVTKALIQYARKNNEKK